MTAPDTGEPADSLSTNVVRAVATREGVSVAELDPLFEDVEPDVLDALFDSSDGYVTFPYCGYEVTVDASGAVTSRSRRARVVPVGSSPPVRR